MLDSTSAPDDMYEFSPLDEIIPPLYNAFILTFSCSPEQKDKIVSVLVNGWRMTLDDWKFLQASVGFDQTPGVRPGTLKLGYRDYRLDEFWTVNDLTRADSGWNNSYDDLKAQGMPPGKLDAKFLAPLAAGLERIDKLVFAQINLVPGGCLIAFCFSHSFTDAKGCSLILEVWAQQCRRLQDATNEEVQRDLMQLHLSAPTSDKMRTKAKFDGLQDRSGLWHLLGLHATGNLQVRPLVDAKREFQHFPAAATAPGSPETTTCIFSFSSQSIKQLKEDSAPQGQGWISSGDALVALLWVSVMRARFPPSKLKAIDESRESIVTVAVDGRKILDPPLSPSYIGNVIFCCMTRLALSTVLSPDTPLSLVATAIRRNVNIAKDPQTLSDAIQLAASIPDVSALQFAFDDFAGADLITTSWIDLPFYELNFGPLLGKPDFFRTPDKQFGGIVSLHPRKNNHVDISILLEAEQMGRLRVDESFRRYAESL